MKYITNKMNEIQVMDYIMDGKMNRIMVETRKKMTEIIKSKIKKDPMDNIDNILNEVDHAYNLLLEYLTENL